MMDRNLVNIYVEEKGSGLSYRPPGTPRDDKSKYPVRMNRKEHGRDIERQFIEAWEAAKAAQPDKSVVSAITRKGVYLEIRGQSGYELITKSLEDVRQGVRLLSVKEEADEEVALVFVPKNKQHFFLSKIEKYTEKDSGTDVIGTIEHITNALIETMWIGDKDKMPDESQKVWCEAWLRYETKEDPAISIEEFSEACELNSIVRKSEAIVFPERVVVGIYVNLNDLKKLLNDTDRLAEIRKMVAPNDFFLNLNLVEQEDWSEDLLARTVFNNDTNTAVCILDTGVNNGHPLLEKLLIENNMHSVDLSKGVFDKAHHGTRMAGITGYFDLRKAIENSGLIHVTHSLESVKVMDRNHDNPEEVYGAITSQAISLAEIQHPQAKRIICMAITAPQSIREDGRPTSWSAAIDGIISGTYNGENKKARLMCISAGNTTIGEVEEANGHHEAIILHSIEDPGQAWNAITVGAYTEMTSIGDDYKEYCALAEKGDVSPFTSTSMSWDTKWPIKPDIVLEGGNLAYNELGGNYTELTDLQLLTTNAEFKTVGMFDTISMTSSATAQAAWILAKIQRQYPEWKPETIRALLIHSAEWTSKMKSTILKTNNPLKADYKRLLRTCGYGVPSLMKASWSAENSVNLIIEDEIQPYIKKPGQTSVTLNEMHLHELPWPNDMLLELGNAPVKMKVTLSYYIEPGPGEKGWKDKYRYPSCGLIFDVNKPTENKEDFSKRISILMRDEEASFDGDSARWRLGARNRNVGSIHSDVWEGYAGELSESNLIMVYPVTGWWKVRTNEKRYNSKVKYSLIITIETPENEVDLYTEIANKIMIKTEITAF